LPKETRRPARSRRPTRFGRPESPVPPGVPQHVDFESRATLQRYERRDIPRCEANSDGRTMPCSAKVRHGCPAVGRTGDRDPPHRLGQVAAEVAGRGCLPLRTMRPARGDSKASRPIVSSRAIQEDSYRRDYLFPVGHPEPIVEPNASLCRGVPGFDRNRYSHHLLVCFN
jgi:hypothetical protein